MTAAEDTPQFPEMIRRFGAEPTADPEPDVAGHKEDAIAWLKAAARPDITAEMTTGIATIAQAHATLAVAEQQLLANRIAWQKLTGESVNRVEIRKALGL